MLFKRNVTLAPGAVDEMTSVYEILQYARQHYPDKTAYLQLEGRKEESRITFEEFGEKVDSLRQAIIDCEGSDRKHIAIFGETSYQWIMTYLAIVSGAGVCIPVDRELNEATLVEQINFADVDTVFCSAKSLKKLKKILPECPRIQKVVIMRGDVPEGDTGEGEKAYKTFSLDGLLERGRQLMQDQPREISIDVDEICIIIFTSGTTGANKGVMLSNRNVTGTLKGCARLLEYPDTSISVLPVNHSYELHAHLMSCLYCGTTVFLNNDLKYMLKNLEHYKPQMSCMVPMMLELIQKKVMAEIRKQNKEEEYKKALLISNALRKIGIDQREKLFKDVRQVFGGRLHMIICGGAALSQEIIDFFDGIGIQIYNGYGITECSPVVAVNASRGVRKGSVGYVLPYEKVRIHEPDESGKGEVQVRGDNVMKGYYKLPRDTEQVFTKDGWFRTGDIGYKDKHDFLYLKGRLKNLIILSNGKNIFPEEIEDLMMKSIPYIKECVVLTDKHSTGLYALVYLDPEFCKSKELPDSPAKKAYMQADFDAFNKDMPGYKKILDFKVVTDEFEKSSTMKIKRFKIKYEA